MKRKVKFQIIDPNDPEGHTIKLIGEGKFRSDTYEELPEAIRTKLEFELGVQLPDGRAITILRTS